MVARSSYKGQRLDLVHQIGYAVKLSPPVTDPLQENMGRGHSAVTCIFKLTGTDFSDSRHLTLVTVCGHTNYV